MDTRMRILNNHLTSLCCDTQEVNNNTCQFFGNRDEFYDPNFAREEKTELQKSKEGGDVKVNFKTSCD